ncbi:unnamed protein product [Coregonus sp. 'balchen']|nr:unnamed protein product [Coregonus sp. 'balchen']
MYCLLGYFWINASRREQLWFVQYMAGDCISNDGCQQKWFSQALLVHRLPSGIYIDQYQLASLKEDTGLQVLLGSEVDLEAPAHISDELIVLVYPAVDQGSLKATLPIHGRYHKPSLAGKRFELVLIELPKLILRTDTCTQLISFPPYKIEQDPVSLEIPLGDGSLVEPVCAGTLLVTLLCCVILSRSIWRHGVF